MINRAETADANVLLRYMPDWMVEEVSPCPPEQVAISYDGESGLFVVTRSDKEGEEAFEGLPAAYDSAYALDASQYELLFSRSLMENPRVTFFSEGAGGEDGESRSINSVFWQIDPNNPKSSSRLFSSRGWAAGIRSNEEDLNIAHQREEEWLANPDDVVLAHSFVRRHPAAWQHFDVESDPLNGYWETETPEAYSVEVWYGKDAGFDSEAVFHLEGHIRNDDSSSRKASPFAFHPGLMADGETFEVALLLLAKLYHKFYDCCGNERVNTPNGYVSPPCKWAQRSELDSTGVN